MKKKLKQKIKNVYLVLSTIGIVVLLVFNIFGVRLNIYDIKNKELENKKLEIELSNMTPKFEQHFLTQASGHLMDLLTKQNLENKEGIPYWRYPVISNEVYKDYVDNKHYGDVTMFIIEQYGKVKADNVKLEVIQYSLKEPIGGYIYPDNLVNYADCINKIEPGKKIIDLELGSLDTGDGVIIPLYIFSSTDFEKHEDMYEKYSACVEEGRDGISMGSVNYCFNFHYSIDGYLYVPIKIKYIDAGSGEYKEEDVRDLLGDTIQLRYDYSERG